MDLCLIVQMLEMIESLELLDKLTNCCYGVGVILPLFLGGFLPILPK